MSENSLWGNCVADLHFCFVISIAQFFHFQTAPDFQAYISILIINADIYAAWFVSDLVGKPRSRFFRDVALGQPIPEDLWSCKCSPDYCQGINTTLATRVKKQNFCHLHVQLNSYVRLSISLISLIVSEIFKKEMHSMINRADGDVASTRTIECFTVRNWA